MGTFGHIREAVYRPSIAHSEYKDLLNKKKSYDEDLQKELFKDPTIDKFAIKTLKKKQQNVTEKILPNEILSMIKIQTDQ